MCASAVRPSDGNYRAMSARAKSARLGAHRIGPSKYEFEGPTDHEPVTPRGLPEVPPIRTSSPVLLTGCPAGANPLSFRSAPPCGAA
jgi:hypothetical protein